MTRQALITLGLLLAAGGALAQSTNTNVYTSARSVNIMLETPEAKTKMLADRLAHHADVLRKAGITNKRTAYSVDYYNAKKNLANPDLVSAYLDAHEAILKKGGLWFEPRQKTMLLVQ
jgi:hypothetical protein